MKVYLIKFDAYSFYENSMQGHILLKSGNGKYHIKIWATPEVIQRIKITGRVYHILVKDVKKQIVNEYPSFNANFVKFGRKL